MSKYLSAFREVTGEFQLIGDFLLVELIRDEEFSKKIKTDDGRTVDLTLRSSSTQKQISGLAADKPTFVRVLAVGEGFYDDETKTDIPLDTKPGQILLVATNSVKPFSVFGKLLNYGEVEIGLTRESDVQARFASQEDFDRYFERLNRVLAPATQS